jgi:hypothetical protein
VEVVEVVVEVDEVVEVETDVEVEVEVRVDVEATVASGDAIHPAANTITETTDTIKSSTHGLCMQEIKTLKSRKRYLPAYLNHESRVCWLNSLKLPLKSPAVFRTLFSLKSWPLHSSSTIPSSSTPPHFIS